MMPGLANLHLQITIIAVWAVGPAVDIVRRYYGVDHLHKLCGSMNFSSSSSLFHGSIQYNFVAIGDVQVISNIRYLGVSGLLGVWLRNSKGTRKYVRKPPSLLLARETAGVRECGATLRCELSRKIYSMGLMLRSGGRTLTMLVFLVLRSILLAFEFVVFACVLRFVAVPVFGSHSKCAGLTRSTETDSTLPFIRIFMTLPFLTMTLYGPS